MSLGQVLLALLPLAASSCDGIECVKSYINKQDGHFSWADTGHTVFGTESETGVGWTGYILNVTSQKWMDESHNDAPTWWHVLVVVVPENVEKNSWATLILEQGVPQPDVEGVEHFSNRLRPNDGFVTYKGRELWPHMQVDATNLGYQLDKIKDGVANSAYIATHTKAVAASLFMPMNNYVQFKSDKTGEKRHDERVKAYSWIDFLRSGAKQPERIIEMPIAKAGAKAMDAVQQFTKTLPTGEATSFALAGYSKHGTTCWMLGATGDHRIKALVPVAMPAEVFKLPPGQREAVKAMQFMKKATNLLQVANKRSKKARKLLDPRMLGRDQSKDGEVTAMLEELTKLANQTSDNALGAYKDLPGEISSHPLGAITLMDIINPVSYIDKITVPTFYVQDTNDLYFGDTMHEAMDWWVKLGSASSSNMLYVEGTHENSLWNGLGPISAFLRKTIKNEPMPRIQSSLAGKTLNLRGLEGHPSSVSLHMAVEGDRNAGPTISLLSGDRSNVKADFLHSNWFVDEAPIHKTGENAWTADLGGEGIRMFAQNPRKRKMAFMRLSYPDEVDVSTYAYMLQ